MKLYIILLITLGIILSISFCQRKRTEQFSNYHSDCGDYPDLLQKVMKDRNMTDNKSDYDIHIPCSYNSCEKDILAFENTKTKKKLFLIDGCDQLGSKLALWALLKEYYGDYADNFMPRTYLLENKEDLEEFPQHFEENKQKRPDQMYVLKNYAQRQEGIKLTRNLDEIMGGLKDGWYLVQDYIYNPYIISQRKINFRYYLLVTCIDDTISGYIHKDGFLYYTPEFYDEHDISFHKHITTGYIDRKVYQENPLTLDDFRNHLDKQSPDLSKVWDTSANFLMNRVMTAISMKICKNKKLDNIVRFQLFGCDLAPSAKLEAQLMEINKGPDMDAKDERDKMVKMAVQKDIFKIIDPKPDDDNNRFVKIF